MRKFLIGDDRLECDGAYLKSADLNKNSILTCRSYHERRFYGIGKSGNPRIRNDEDIAD